MMGGPTDRIPVGNVVSIVHEELMDACGVYYPHAHLHAEAMAELAAAGHEILDYDTVMPVFSVTQEAAALGCEMDWGNVETNPTVRSHPFADTGDIRIPDGWMESQPIQVVLDALSILRRQLGEHVAIVGKVMGPWTLSYHMMGTEEFLATTASEPDLSLRCLHMLKHVTIEFARAQMRAGADIICIADHATGGMVSPLVYRDMLLPIHQEITAEVGCPMVLHCCGDTSDRIGYFAQSGVDCYHFESHVDVTEAVKAVGGKITLIGNINNPNVLLRGTQDDVRHASEQAIRGGVNILAPECAVPLQTPTANLKALVSAAQEYKP